MHSYTLYHTALLQLHKSIQVNYTIQVVTSYECLTYYVPDCPVTIKEKQIQPTNNEFSRRGMGNKTIFRKASDNNQLYSVKHIYIQITDTNLKVERRIFRQHMDYN